ncbi:MAG: RraA family protein [Chthoniobacter sp.]
MPQMGPMVGYAITVVFEPSKAEHPEKNPHAWSEYREYVASVPGPKIVVVQDLDKPQVIGAFWGEVNSNIHRALGCVGTIVDGAIRDLDEMTNAGFKALARRMCVGHAFSCPVRWNCEVEVFGRKVQRANSSMRTSMASSPSRRRTSHVCSRRRGSWTPMIVRRLIPAARGIAGKPTGEVLAAINEAGRKFGENARGKFGRKGEW